MHFYDFRLKLRDEKVSLTKNHLYSTSDRCLVTEFEELTALGPKITPLVVYKLASEPESFMGVQLCMSTS